MMETPQDLLIALEYAYEPNGFITREFVQEVESQDYDACLFSLNGKRIVFRIAKITPIIKGQFLTIWKRIEDGPIMPVTENATFPDVFGKPLKEVLLF